ncbi:MAG: 6-pyruvoyl tetrahydropterin synthase family protein [Pirellulaceae bacterium]
MSESYCVRLEKEYHVFSAAHFITFNGDVCERIHGHNYRVFAEVDGPLDENHYVVDFIAMRDELRAIVDGLDHYVILPTQHPLIQVTANDTEVEARFRERRWIFPRGDCVLLPVENTTAELVARYIAFELLNRLERRCGFRPNVCRVGVDENHGQWAIYETIAD